MKKNILCYIIIYNSISSLYGDIMKEEYTNLRKTMESSTELLTVMVDELDLINRIVSDGVIVTGSGLCSDEISSCADLLCNLMEDSFSFITLCKKRENELTEIETETVNVSVEENNSEIEVNAVNEKTTESSNLNIENKNYSTSSSKNINFTTEFYLK